MALIKLISKYEENIAELLMGLIIVLVFLAAAFRWFGYPLVWSVDIAQLLFGWVVFLGADVALRNNSHIGIDALVNLLPARIRRTILIFEYFIVCAFLIMIAIYGVHLTFANYERQFNSIAISYSYATASVPVGCLLMLITMGMKIRAMFTKTPPADDANAGTELAPW